MVSESLKKSAMNPNPNENENKMRIAFNDIERNFQCLFLFTTKKGKTLLKKHLTLNKKQFCQIFLVLFVNFYLLPHRAHRTWSIPNVRLLRSVFVCFFPTFGYCSAVTTFHSFGYLFFMEKKLYRYNWSGAFLPKRNWIIKKSFTIQMNVRVCM